MYVWGLFGCHSSTLTFLLFLFPSFLDHVGETYGYSFLYSQDAFMGTFVSHIPWWWPIALKLDSNLQERNLIWYWKPSQLHRASEVRNLGEEPRATTLLNPHRLSLCPKHLFLNPQRSVFLTSHQRSLSLQHRKPHGIKVWSWSAQPSGKQSTKQVLHLRFREHCENGDRET